MDESNPLYAEYLEMKANPRAYINKQRQKLLAADRVRLREAGFNVEKYDEKQIALILQPTEAPEVFYGDGTLSEEKAVDVWIGKLINAGISITDIKLAGRFNFKK